MEATPRSLVGEKYTYRFTRPLRAITGPGIQRDNFSLVSANLLDMSAW